MKLVVLVYIHAWRGQVYWFQTFGVFSSREIAERYVEEVLIAEQPYFVEHNIAMYKDGFSYEEFDVDRGQLMTKEQFERRYKLLYNGR